MAQRVAGHPPAIMLDLIRLLPLLESTEPYWRAFQGGGHLRIVPLHSELVCIWLDAPGTHLIVLILLTEYACTQSCKCS